MGGARVRLTPKCRKDIKKAVAVPDFSTYDGVYLEGERAAAVIDMFTETEMLAVREFLTNTLRCRVTWWKWNKSSHGMPRVTQPSRYLRITVGWNGVSRRVTSSSYLWGRHIKRSIRAELLESNFIDE